jgi:Mrp family chromosome partitioning ATPase
VEPSFPQKLPLLMLGGLVGICTGLFAVFIAEVTNRKVRFARDVERATGVPVLAALPSVGSRPQDEIIRHPGSAYDDAIVSLQAGLGIGPAHGTRGRIVLVTSTGRGEGRTSTAIALGRSLAQSGLRVLLIDGDFRRPGIGPLFGAGMSWGFSDLVTGRAAYKQVVMRDPASRMHLMTAGQSGAAAFSGPRLRQALQWLSRGYDVIVLDGAPMSEWGGAQAFVSEADSCVYAVRWNATDRDRLAAGLRRLSYSDTKADIGVVMTQKDATFAA